MTVIADTSPLNYLILIDAAGILPALYGLIRITPSCASELTATGAPAAVRQWMARKPGWMEVARPHDVSDPSFRADPALLEVIQRRASRKD